MTYHVEQDENGEQALFLTAIVRNNEIDLDWVREEDNEVAYIQRGLVRLKRLALDTDPPSFPPRTAALTLRLCQRGQAIVTNVACVDEYRDEAMRIASEAALALYDQVFPAVALQAKAFVEESVENVNRFAANDALHAATVETGKQLATDQFLPHLLDLAKADLENTGQVVQQIGWLGRNGMALFPTATPLEKYRYFKAVSEVAQRVTADAVVYVSDNFQLDTRGERTGVEIVLVTWINPNGTCVSTGATYTRRKHPHIQRDIITFLDELPTHKSEQSFLPAWGTYKPNSLLSKLGFERRG